MLRRLTLLLIFQLVVVCSMAQTIEEQIRTADELYDGEDYSKSLDIRKKILTKIPDQASQLFFRQKQLLLQTEAQLEDDTQRTLDKAKEALEVFKKIDNPSTGEELDIYNLLYHAYAENDQNEEALSAALISYENVNKDTSYHDTKKIDLSYDVGYMYDLNGNYFEAIKYYKESLGLYIDRYGEVGEDVALNYHNLAYAYGKTYNLRYSITYYAKAAEIWEKVFSEKEDNKEQLITALQNLNRNLVNYGDYEEAKIVNAKVNDLFYKKYANQSGLCRERYMEARQLMILSNVRTTAVVGDLIAARAYCDSLKSEIVFSEKNKKQINLLMTAYSLVGDYSYEEKDFQETIVVYDMISEYAYKYDLPHQKMIVNATLGTSYEKLKAYDKGLYHIELADQLIDKNRFTSSKFSIQVIKAKLLRGKNEFSQVEKLIRENLERLILENTDSKVKLEDFRFEMVQDLASDSFINIISASGHLYLDIYKNNQRAGDLVIAENLFRISASLFREYYLKGEFNEILDYYHQRITEGLLEVALLNKSTMAEKVNLLNLIEQNASQHLLKEYNKKIKRKNIETQLDLSKITALTYELDYYGSKAYSSNTDSIKANEKIVEIGLEIDSLNKKISETEKNYDAFNSADFDLNKVLAVLPKNQQLLKYYVGIDFAYSVLIYKDDIIINKIGESADLEKKVAFLIDKTKDIQSDFKSSTTDLYSILLPSNLENRITIIPDDILNYVPFESLYNKNSKEFLIQNHTVSYDYSLPMWLMHQDHKNNLGVNKLAAFAPEYAADLADTRGSTFKSLRFAGQEASTIAASFPGDLFSKEQATKFVFLEAKDAYSIFHLSMHSELYEDDFNQSFLLFSNDEKLYFSDLYGMDIPAQMVVLSACNTGNGSMKRGEGIMSLSRALTYAGVESSIVSLWQVPDKETSEIMIAFYENLKNGQSKDEALRNAKTHFLENNPMKTHPFYWAGFIVNGNTDAIKSGANWIYYALGLTAFFLILGGFLWKRNT